MASTGSETTADTSNGNSRVGVYSIAHLQHPMHHSNVASSTVPPSAPIPQGINEVSLLNVLFLLIVI